MKKVGVLALQGAFQAHIERLVSLGAAAHPIRFRSELDGIDALVMPGGESTTMSLLLGANDLVAPLSDLIGDGLPVFGTCAGMILLASDILDGRDDQIAFNALPISVRRNGYGRQLASFEADLQITGIEHEENPFRAVFIRAPKVESVGAGLEVLANVDGDPVMVRLGPVWATAFHPELTDDLRVHAAFLKSL
ncbi:MAG: pyridoxal 5'-phosphate synthase glutaminase subunit PdxT [Acidimicrobiales bacterium]|nr:pyridoxal 5'-phosphate synthase glutaminase subunit PdxT [Acidimicrobiales bacterium]